MRSLLFICLVVPVPRLLNPPLHWRKVVASPSGERLSTPSTCTMRCNAPRLPSFSVFQPLSKKPSREDNGDRHLVTPSAAWRICMKITVTRSSFLPADATSCRNKKKRKKERKKKRYLQRQLRRDILGNYSWTSILTRETIILSDTHERLRNCFLTQGKATRCMMISRTFVISRLQYLVA